MTDQAITYDHNGLILAFRSIAPEFKIVIHPAEYYFCFFWSSQPNIAAPPIIDRLAISSATPKLVSSELLVWFRMSWAL